MSEKAPLYEENLIEKSLTENISVEAYIAMQPKLAWKRRLLRGFFRPLCFNFLWNVEVTGTENIPASGSTMLIMNHISGIDPFLAIGAVPHRYLIPMTKIENLKVPVIGWLISQWGSYTVRRGEVDRKALLNSIELAKSGQLILIAPEGTRSPEGLSQPKDGMSYIATKADAVIVPMGISGAIEWWDELKKLRRAHIRVNFGRPFKFKTQGRARIPRDELSRMTDEAMLQLALAISDPSLRGVYSDVSKASTEHLEFVASDQIVNG